jgi:signal transduction histidine kinase
VVPADESKQHNLLVIQRAATRMERLIGDLLDVASIEKGTLRLHSAPLDLSAVLSDVLELFEDQARERKIDVYREIESGIPVIPGDYDRLIQALSNILGNAMKFTAQGGSVRIAVTRNDDTVVVSVADTGIGISADELPHVFDRFWRARENRTKGAGLGLSIACGIIEAHGGRMWADSKLGVGTTITFALPIA